MFNKKSKFLDFRLLNLPYLTKTNDRLSVLDHLVDLLSHKNCRPFETESAKFRLFDGEVPLSIEESYLMKVIFTRWVQTPNPECQIVKNENVAFCLPDHPQYGILEYMGEA